MSDKKALEFKKIIVISMYILTVLATLNYNVLLWVGLNPDPMFVTRMWETTFATNGVYMMVSMLEKNSRNKYRVDEFGHHLDSEQ